MSEKWARVVSGRRRRIRWLAVDRRPEWRNAVRKWRRKVGFDLIDFDVGSSDIFVFLFSSRWNFSHFHQIRSRNVGFRGGWRRRAEGEGEKCSRFGAQRRFSDCSGRYSRLRNRQRILRLQSSVLLGHGR